MTESLPVIRINQTGYAEPLPVQVAVLSAGPVSIEDAKGNVIETVETGELPFDEASGDNVKVVNFGVLSAGEYRITCGKETRQIHVKRTPGRMLPTHLSRGFTSNVADAVLMRNMPVSLIIPLVIPLPHLNGIITRSLRQCSGDGMMPEITVNM